MLELRRYMHLNPLRVGMVEGMERLQRYAWTGHSAIMGSVRRHWQDTDTVLAYFGKRRIEAMGQYEAFVRGGIEQDKRDRSWLEAAFSGAVVDGHRFFL